MKKQRFNNILFLIMILSVNTFATTMKDVVIETLDNDSKIEALNINTKATKYYVDEQKGKNYPSVSLESYYEDKRTDKKNANKSTQTGTNTKLKLEQNIYSGGLISSQIDEKRYDFNAVSLKNKIEIDDIILESIKAYLDLVKNKELSLLSLNNIMIHEDYLRVAVESELVSGDTLDRLQVEAKLLSAKTKNVQISSDFQSSKHKLKKYYKKPITKVYCRPNMLYKIGNIQDLAKQVVKHNYSILEEVEKIKTQKAVISQEKSKFLPTLDATLLREIDDGVDVKDVDKTEDSIKFTFKYNIFNGLQDSASYEREKLFLKESRKNLTERSNDVLKSLKITYTKYYNSKKKVDYLKSYVKKSKEILNVYLEQFEGGTRTFIDVLNQEAELYRAKTELINEEYNVLYAYYELLNINSILSKQLLSEENQICKAVTVDTQRRDLNKIEEQNDAELENLLEDNTSVQDNALLKEETELNKDKEVKNILNNILNEVYQPDLKNKTIKIDINEKELMKEISKQENIKNKTKSIDKNKDESIEKEILNQDSKKFTIALYTLKKKDYLNEAIKRYNLNNIFAYKLKNSNKTYYKVLYGVYNTKQEAKDALQKLPNDILKREPYVDIISKHSKLFKKYNTQKE